MFYLRARCNHQKSYTWLASHTSQTPALDSENADELETEDERTNNKLPHLPEQLKGRKLQLTQSKKIAERLGAKPNNVYIVESQM